MKDEWKQTRLVAGALTAALLLTSGALATEHGAQTDEGAPTAVVEPSVPIEKAAQGSLAEAVTAATSEEALSATEPTSQETDAPDAAAPAGETALEETASQKVVAPETAPSQEDAAGEKAQPYIQPNAQTAQDWRLLLVNPWNMLPENYQMELTTLSNGLKVDARIDEDLQAMLSACREAGLQPIVCSAYRTQATQVRLYNNKIARLRAAGWDESTLLTEAARWVAPPGTSEHQTGLALDIVSAGYQLLDEAQADTAEQQWLMEHCWEYGFILRYPEDKTDITGIGYEPWHYRYVGRETAAAIRESGLCLEEYLQTLPLPAATDTTASEGTAAEESGVPAETAQAENAAQESNVTENTVQELDTTEKVTPEEVTSAAAQEIDPKEAPEPDGIPAVEATPEEAVPAQET